MKSKKSQIMRRKLISLNSLSNKKAYGKYSVLRGTLRRRLNYRSNLKGPIHLIQEFDRQRAKRDDRMDRMTSALHAAILALGDWVNIYAPEFCDEQRVEEAKARINEQGTLQYVATVIQQCEDSLK